MQNKNIVRRDVTLDNEIYTLTHYSPREFILASEIILNNNLYLSETSRFSTVIGNYTVPSLQKNKPSIHVVILSLNGVLIGSCLYEIPMMEDNICNIEGTDYQDIGIVGFYIRPDYRGKRLSKLLADCIYTRAIEPKQRDTWKHKATPLLKAINKAYPIINDVAHNLLITDRYYGKISDGIRRAQELKIF